MMGAHVAGKQITEWWMNPGEYWDDGLVCETDNLGSEVVTYCHYEPWLIEKVWDWNWQHVVLPSFPWVWIVLAVLVFIGSAVYIGLNRSGIVSHDCYGLWTFLSAVFLGIGGALWEAYIAIALVAGMWGLIFWLTGKGGLAALRAREAKAKARRAELVSQAETLEKLVEPLDGDEVVYKEAALAAAASLRAQAGEVKS